MSNFFQLNKWLYLFFTLVSVLIFSMGLATWFFWEDPLKNPVSSDSIFTFLLELAPKSQEPMLIYGFLPYWNLQNLQLQPEVKTIGYFGLGIGADGSLQLRSEGENTPGFTGLQSEKLLELANVMEERNGGIDLVLTQFLGGDIQAFLGSPKAQDKFLEMLDMVIMAYPISGVNIDIEPSGIEITPQLRDQFTNFMKKLRLHLSSKYESIPLSVDVYASASNNKQIWDIPAIAKEVDFIVVMAYDYHRRSSPQAGPVAPIFGDSHLSETINEHLQAFLNLAPADKFVLGIPFYGYGWQTTDKSATANTYPESGFTATLKKVEDILSKKTTLQVEEFWNEKALSPYIAYKEDGKTYIIYYENPRSIAYKIDLARDLRLKGIAIWALGYESEDRSLWEVISKKK